MILQEIQQTLQAAGVRLVAVSKTKPTSAILDLYEQGQRDFGENKAQELAPKYEALPKDIRWHMIGHLQTNKVKYIAPFVHLIHSADSEKILQEINKQAAKHDRVIDCLLQFKIAAEDTKYGFDLPTAEAMLASVAWQELQHIRIVGVMGMATFTDDEAQVRAEFSRLQGIFEHLQGKYFAGNAAFREISMGMSDDYHLAIAEGSTMVRIGTLLFGQRE